MSWPAGRDGGGLAVLFWFICSLILFFDFIVLFDSLVSLLAVSYHD